MKNIQFVFIAIFVVALMSASTCFAGGNEGMSITSEASGGKSSILLVVALNQQRSPLLKKKLKSNDSIVRQYFGSPGSAQTMDGKDDGKVCSSPASVRKTETQCQDIVVNGVDYTMCCPFSCSYSCAAQRSGTGRPIGPLNPGKLSGQCRQTAGDCTTTRKPAAGSLTPSQTQ